MKKNLLIILLPFFICCLFSSCSEDDDGGYSKKLNQENVIKFKVISNTLDAPVTISEFYGGNLIIKNSWENEFVTKDYGTHFFATCENETVLMTGEIYVNGKLKLRKEGNKRIELSVNVK